MARPKQKKLRLNFKMALVAGVAAAATAAAVYLILDTPFKSQTVSANGESVRLRQAGEGPHFVVVGETNAFRGWDRLARTWVKTYHLTVIDPDDTGLIKEAMAKIDIASAYLLAFGENAGPAVRLAAAHQELFKQIVLINPIWPDTADMQAVSARVKQQSLVLIGRKDPSAEFSNLRRLTQDLRNAQTAFHPQAGSRILEHEAEWISAKVKNFIDFTNLNPSGS